MAPPPVQLLFPVSDRALLDEAAKGLGLSPEQLVLTCAAAFARERGFGLEGAGNLWNRGSPFLGARAGRVEQDDRLTVTIPEDLAPVFASAAGYFKFQSARGLIEPVSLPEFLQVATLRTVASIRAAGKGWRLPEVPKAAVVPSRSPPPSKAVATSEGKMVLAIAVGATVLGLGVFALLRPKSAHLPVPTATPTPAPHSQPSPEPGEDTLAELLHSSSEEPSGQQPRRAPAFSVLAAKPSRADADNIDAFLERQYGRPSIPARVAAPSRALPTWLQPPKKAKGYEALDELLEAVPADQAYDVAIALAVADVAPIHPVPPALVKGIIRRESNFNPKAKSKSGAIGLMQVMPFTAERVGLTEDELWIPEKNILGGVRLLAVLLKYYQGDVISALTAYNARPRKLFAPVPRNGETPEYVAAVLAYYQEYNGKPLRKSSR